MRRSPADVKPRKGTFARIRGPHAEDEAMTEQAADYRTMFPLREDTTPWRKLTADHVRAVDFDGTAVLKVEPAALERLAAEAFADVNHLLRPGHLAQLRKLLDDPEASDNDRRPEEHTSELQSLMRHSY